MGTAIADGYHEDGSDGNRGFDDRTGHGSDGRHREAGIQAEILIPSGIYDVRPDGTVMVSGLPIVGWDGAIEVEKARVERALKS